MLAEDNALAFASHQGKEKAPATSLKRLRRLARCGTASGGEAEAQEKGACKQRLSLGRDGGRLATLKGAGGREATQKTATLRREKTGRWGLYNEKGPSKSVDVAALPRTQGVKCARRRRATGRR